MYGRIAVVLLALAAALLTLWIVTQWNHNVPEVGPIDLSTLQPAERSAVEVVQKWFEQQGYKLPPVKGVEGYDGGKLAVRLDVGGSMNEREPGVFEEVIVVDPETMQVVEVVPAE